MALRDPLLMCPRPWSNLNATTVKFRRKLWQLKKEELKKFFQHLFGQRFFLITDHKPLLAIYGNKKTSSGLVVNCLIRWAMFFINLIFRSSITGLQTIRTQMMLILLVQFLLFLFRCKHLIVHPCRRKLRKIWPYHEWSALPEKVWPHKSDDVNLEKFWRLVDSLTFLHRCLLYSIRVVIPTSLQHQVLKLLHEDILQSRGWNN